MQNLKIKGRCPIPEGVEVRRFAQDLNKLFVDKTMSSIDIVGGKFIKFGVPGLNNISFPLHKTEIKNSGKFLWWQFEEDIVIFNTLGMSGSFGGKNKHSAIKFNFDDGTHIYFNDIRRFGNIKIANRNELKLKLNSLGWDPFSELEVPDWLLSFFRLKNKKTIVEAMMDQSILNGCGNYIKSDTLYLSKIHPNSLVQDLSDEQILTICKNFSLVAHESFAAGGATIATYSDINGNIGKYNKKVYKKDFDPEGNPVTKIETKDKRSSYFVDKYQKL